MKTWPFAGFLIKCGVLAITVSSALATPAATPARTETEPPIKINSFSLELPIGQKLPPIGPFQYQQGQDVRLKLQVSKTTQVQFVGMTADQKLVPVSHLADLPLSVAKKASSSTIFTFTAKQLGLNQIFAVVSPRLLSDRVLSARIHLSVHSVKRL